MPFLGFLPNMSVRDAADREIEYGQGKADRSGTKDYNWMDKVGGFLGGYDQAGVEAEIKRRLDAKLIDKVGGQITTNQAVLGGYLDPEFKGIDGKTDKEVAAELAVDKTRGKNLQDVLANADVEDLSELSRSATAGQILGFGGRATRDRNESKEKATKDEAREIRMLENSINNRRLDIQQSQLTGQQAYENRRLDMQDARDSRSARDKQLMMIIQGLNAFGQGFQ